MGDSLGLVQNLVRAGAPDLARDPVLARDLVGDGVSLHGRDSILAPARVELDPGDPGFEVLRNPVPFLDLERDLGASLSAPLNSREEEAWDAVDGLVRPTGFRPGTYRGRGGGIISRSGARSAALEDAAGLSGLHRLMNRNRALEQELLRVKGMIPPSLDVAPDCSGIGSLQMDGLVRSKGGTLAVRGNASEGKVQDPAGVAVASAVAVDGRETEVDFLPPVAGVGLDKFISAALSARLGSSKGKRTGDGKSGLNKVANPGLTVSNMDPFPPLSRAAGGLGTVGDSASSRTFHDAVPDSFLGDHGTAGMKQAEGGVNKFSWKDLVRSSKPDNVCVDLHYVKPTIIDGEECAVFTLEEEAENLMQWQNTLLCYVVGKSPSYYQFLKSMQRQWNTVGGLEMFTRENGIFFCKFESEIDMKKVIKEGPWYMDGKLVVVKKFTGETNCEEDMLSSIPIWVKLPCLPLQWWSIEGVSKVVSPLGHPLYFDLPSASKSRIAFARCCVEVAMEKTLPSSVLCMGGDKVKKRQAIIYDWVPKRCSACKEFGHVVAECGGSKPRQQQVGKGGWFNNKKMGKEQQAYVPKAKNQIIEVDGQLITNSHKEGGVAGKEKQTMMDGGSMGAINKSNLLYKSMETSKATSANPFQLLVGMDGEVSGGKLEGDIKGIHTYFHSDDEEEDVDDVDDLALRNEAQIQNIVEAEELSNAEEMVTPAKTLESGLAIKEVEAEVLVGSSAEDVSREQVMRESEKEIENELPMHENQGSESDNENHESESEAEEEESIRSYGKNPAESGMPPMLTVPNPKFQGMIDVPKESKKKRSAPAPERPAGSRTTRHSFRVG